MDAAKAGERKVPKEKDSSFLCVGAWNERQLFKTQGRQPWLAGMESTEGYQYQIAKSTFSYTSFMAMT